MQDVALQGLTLVLMRRATRLIVPGAGTAIHQLFLWLIPGPYLHQTIHPEVQVETGLVAVEVANLLLPRTPDLFDILVCLLHSTTVGHGFQDFFRGYLF